MKKNYFLSMLALTALAMGFTSCNNDDETTGQAGQEAKLQINVTAPETRAQSTTAPAVADGTVISNYTVFVFNDLGVLENRVNGTAASIEVTGITTRAKDVYVVANAGTGTPAIPTTVKSKTALEAWVGDLKTSAPQTAARWAAGKNGSAFNFTKSGSDNVATTSVVMKFIAARITVKIEPMSDYAKTPTNPKSLIIKNVSILNAGAATKLFSTPSLIPTVAERGALKPFFAGISMTGMANAPAAANYAVETFLKDDLTALDKGDFAGKYFYFYSFENNATSAAQFPTIVVVEGTYDGQAIYYPVHLAQYQTFNTGSLTAGVERGKSYDITIKMNGKASFDTGGTYPGDTGGDDDPTDDPSEAGKLTVSLSIGNWVPQVLVKEF